jgi:hypothetical protein
MEDKSNSVNANLEESNSVSTNGRHIYDQWFQFHCDNRNLEKKLFEQLLENLPNNQSTSHLLYLLCGSDDLSIFQREVALILKQYKQNSILPENFSKIQDCKKKWCFPNDSCIELYDLVPFLTYKSSKGCVIFKTSGVILRLLCYVKNAVYRKIDLFIDVSTKHGKSEFANFSYEFFNSENQKGMRFSSFFDSQNFALILESLKTKEKFKYSENLNSHNTSHEFEQAMRIWRGFKQIEAPDSCAISQSGINKKLVKTLIAREEVFSVKFFQENWLGEKKQRNPPKDPLQTKNRNTKKKSGKKKKAYEEKGRGSVSRKKVKLEKVDGNDEMVDAHKHMNCEEIEDPNQLPHFGQLSKEFPGVTLPAFSEENLSQFSTFSCQILNPTPKEKIIEEQNQAAPSQHIVVEENTKQLQQEIISSPQQVFYTIYPFEDLFCDMDEFHKHFGAHRKIIIPLTDSIPSSTSNHYNQEQHQTQAIDRFFSTYNEPSETRFKVPPTPQWINIHSVQICDDNGKPVSAQNYLFASHIQVRFDVHLIYTGADILKDTSNFFKKQLLDLKLIVENNYYSVPNHLELVCSFERYLDFWILCGQETNLDLLLKELKQKIILGCLQIPENKTDYFCLFLYEQNDKANFFAEEWRHCWKDWELSPMLKTAVTKNFLSFQELAAPAWSWEWLDKKQKTTYSLRNFSLHWMQLPRPTLEDNYQWVVTEIGCSVSWQSFEKRHEEQTFVNIDQEVIESFRIALYEIIHLRKSTSDTYFETNIAHYIDMVEVTFLPRNIISFHFWFSTQISTITLIQKLKKQFFTVLSEKINIALIHNHRVKQSLNSSSSEHPSQSFTTMFSILHPYLIQRPFDFDVANQNYFQTEDFFQRRNKELFVYDENHSGQKCVVYATPVFITPNFFSKQLSAKSALKELAADTVHCIYVTIMNFPELTIFGLNYQILEQIISQQQEHMVLGLTKSLRENLSKHLSQYNPPLCRKFLDYYFAKDAKAIDQFLIFVVEELESTVRKNLDTLGIYDMLSRSLGNLLLDFVIKFYMLLWDAKEFL